MREVKYLSPTSMSKFYADRTEFYLSYLADNRPPRLPQTKPMSVGSAFDAFAKSYLHKALTGRRDAQFELRTIFESQVEPQNRDWAMEAGAWVFRCYQTSGALADLMIELESACEEPRFEFSVESNISHSTCIDGVPLLGKPDVYYRTRGGQPVILDWKVNGYCGRSSTSPAKGYLMCRPGGKQHKDCVPMKRGGVTYNGAMTLEQINEEWAAQTGTYAWLMGEPVCGEFIVGIEQIVGGGYAEGIPPTLRFAKHRCRISHSFQETVFGKYVNVWQTLRSGHIFDNLSRSESDARCQILDSYHKLYESSDDREKWLMEACREQSNY